MKIALNRKPQVYLRQGWTGEASSLGSWWGIFRATEHLYLRAVPLPCYSLHIRPQWKLLLYPLLASSASLGVEHCSQSSSKSARNVTVRLPHPSLETRLTIFAVGGGAECGMSAVGGVAVERPTQTLLIWLKPGSLAPQGNNAEHVERKGENSCSAICYPVGWWAWPRIYRGNENYFANTDSHTR